MGKNWKRLAKLFAIFGVLAGFLGIGTITQVNGIVSAVWTIADTFNGLMAFHNTIVLFALSGVMAKETKRFLQEIQKR